MIHVNLWYKFEVLNCFFKYYHEANKFGAQVFVLFCLLIKDKMLLSFSKEENNCLEILT